jgi:SHS2 domain-containing protein
MAQVLTSPLRESLVLRPRRTRRRRLSGRRDDDQLVAVLEEVIYFLDTAWCGYAVG